MQLSVEGIDLGIFVSGLTGIQLEREQVFAIESEVDRIEIPESSNKEPRRGENEQRRGDLGDNQGVAETYRESASGRGWFGFP